MQPVQGEAFLELNDLLQGNVVDHVLGNVEAFDLNDPVEEDFGDLNVNPDLVLPVHDNIQVQENIVGQVIEAKL